MNLMILATSFKRGKNCANLAIRHRHGDLKGTRSNFDLIYERIAKREGLFRVENGKQVPNRAAAKRWLEEKGLTPHHQGPTTIELIPTDLHGNVPHVGSASDLRICR